MSSNFPIQRFDQKINFQVKIEKEIENEEEEIELGLGLSLNGRFGVDPTSSKRLKRCSSKPEFTDESTSFPTMVRTCSLPVDWMKRKELQTLRRTEARRKRLEKRRFFENRQGMNNKSTESRIPTSSKTLSEEPNEEESLTQNTESEETVRELMSRMPCVSTTGDGPNRRRIRGLLYTNNRGEEVKIVCVCHGSCYSPAEFVKHAGGLEVANPLRRIVVTPSSLF